MDIPALIEAEDTVDGFNFQVNPAPAGEAGGSILGFIGDDTWMEYGVRVSEAASFVLNVRAASPFGVGVINILNENGDSLATVALSPGNTNADFDTYLTYTSSPFALPAGEQVLRLDVVASAFNLNWIDFRIDTTGTNGNCTALDQEENFDNTIGSFSLSSGAFSNPNATYESFTQAATAATLTVGGVDNSTQTNTSLGLSTTFQTTGTEEVVIELDYELTGASQYENDEWTQVLLEVDGQLVSYNGNTYLSQLTGGSVTTSGPQSVSLTLPGLTEGTHTLVFGLLNNKKTYNNESSSLIIDRIRISQACASGAKLRQENASALVPQLDVNVYPNPTRDAFWIKYQLDNSMPVAIRVYDAAGREMFVQERTEAAGLVSQKIQTSRWNAGMYTVVIQTQQSTSSKRVLIIQ
ncbi:MAG: T9SS type A sorting domain-containing protein [Bacteroidota bacterium]